MVNITINDKKFQAEDDATILEVALKAGIKIPTLCYHKELSSYGACRLCLIEIVDGAKPGIQASCTYRVTEGLVVKTDTERVKRSRKIMFELLLAKYPNSDKIKSLAQEYGVTETRIKRRQTSDCILCGRCVRVCAEVVGKHAISFTGRGSEKRVQTPFNKMSEVCIGCGACAYVCPTDIINVKEAE